MASAGVSTAFMPGTGIWTLGASIAQTLFDGGKLEHTKLAAVAAYDKAAAQYRSTVLLAFQDVANALRALQADASALLGAEDPLRLALDMSCAKNGTEWSERM